MSQPTETTRHLSPDERRRLLAQMLKEKASRTAERPLSLGQERLWLMSRLEPDSALYNIAVGYRLLGPLDLAALEQGCRIIADRHEVLRSTFATRDGRTSAVVGQFVASAFSVVDLRALPASERLARGTQLTTEPARRPFDLARGPLCRIAVIRWSDEGHDVVLAMHHIVSDAWSFYVFCRELAECYDARRSGQPPSLGELPLSYAAFGERQRRWLSGQIYQEQLTYWRTQLSGDVPGLLLPTDRRGSATMLHPGSFQSLEIPDRTAAARTPRCS